MTDGQLWLSNLDRSSIRTGAPIPLGEKSPININYTGLDLDAQSLDLGPNK
jgi:hypothetical protein